MGWQIAGLGNALMDALVVVEEDDILDELGLVKGTMHPVDHDRWQQVYHRLQEREITFDSGGSCANAVATAGRLGANAIYCGQVGHDQMGRLYASRIEAACGQHSLQFTDDVATGKCLSIISADAERTMVTDLGASIHLPGLGDFAYTLDNTEIAHFTGYTLLGGPMRNVAIQAMQKAHAAGAIVSIDAADPFVVLEIKDLLWKLLTDYADVVFLNAEESRKLTDLPPHESIRAIADRTGIRTVVVKLGGAGSLVLHKGELTEVPVFPVKAVDTTGAGDAYAGGFLYGLVNRWSARDSGRLASAVAALTVAQIGAVVKDADALAGAKDRARAEA